MNAREMGELRERELRDFELKDLDNNEAVGDFDASSLVNLAAGIAKTGIEAKKSSDADKDAAKKASDAKAKVDADAAAAKASTKDADDANANAKAANLKEALTKAAATSAQAKADASPDDKDLEKAAKKAAKDAANAAADAQAARDIATYYNTLSAGKLPTAAQVAAKDVAETHVENKESAKEGESSFMTKMKDAAPFLVGGAAVLGGFAFLLVKLLKPSRRGRR